MKKKKGVWYIPVYYIILHGFSFWSSWWFYFKFSFLKSSTCISLIGSTHIYTIHNIFLCFYALLHAYQPYIHTVDTGYMSWYVLDGIWYHTRFQYEFYSGFYVFAQKDFSIILGHTCGAKFTILRLKNVKRFFFSRCQPRWLPKSNLTSETVQTQVKYILFDFLDKCLVLRKN